MDWLTLVIAPHFWGADYSTNLQLEFDSVKIMIVENYETTNFEIDSKFTINYNVRF